MRYAYCVKTIIETEGSRQELDCWRSARRVRADKLELFKLNLAPISQLVDLLLFDG